MQFYASPEQIMRDRAEYARRGIARGRSVVVLTYEGGVVFVAENSQARLHKVSEIYDKIGFAAVGRYNEFENLRSAGVRLADLHGYSYDRRDVTGRAIANAYARTLGAIFTAEPKPFEVEVCVAEVRATPEEDELYRLTHDGSVTDEPGTVAMGGQSEAISGVLRTRHRGDMTLSAALRLGVEALASIGGEGGKPRELPATQLEVAVLDRFRPGRAFRRITGTALASLLAETAPPPEQPPAPEEPTPAEEPVEEPVAQAEPEAPSGGSADETTDDSGGEPAP